MDDNQLGKNIKSLRIAYDETLEELGAILGYVKSAVSDYESGRRKPDLQTLQKLSSHYQVPIDMLLKSDLTGLEKCTLDFNSPSSMAELTNKILPLYQSETVLKNKNFKKGYELAQRLLDAQFKGEILSGDVLWRMLEAFSEAADETGEPEAFANIMWSIFIWWSQLGDIQMTLSLQSKQLSNQITQKDILKMQDTQGEEVQENKRNFINDFDDMINITLRYLKSKEGWSMLAEYYLALRYILGVVDTDMSKETNTAVGIQMMYSFSILGNSLASEYLLLVNSFT